MFSQGTSRTRTVSHMYGGSDGPEAPVRPKRDIKKLFLIVGLGTLSWVATYVGMLELIQANMGDLPFIHKLIVGFSVAMLMTMIIWLLDQMFAPVGALTRISYVAGYLFLTLISVGFSFGFYWKVLESRSESGRSAESAVSQVQNSLHGAATRLEQLDATLVQLAGLSTSKAELERSKGTSCPNSKPGDGPRRRMREEDASRFNYASEFVKGRVTSVKGGLGALDSDLAKIVAKDASLIDPVSGTRNEFMKALSRKLDMTVTGFNAFRTDPQLKTLRTELNDRAEKVTFGDPKNGGFVCPDTQLQAALRGAVKAIDELPALEKPVIAAVEGSEATIEAFRRLTATLTGLMTFKMPPSADELRTLQQKAVQSVEGGAAAQRALVNQAVGLSSRDYVPLGVAIFVDLCLLLVSIGRPQNRWTGLMPKMREAEQGPVSDILSRFNDIHRDQEVRESFELFRHVVFDLNGDYYVAVPLDAPPKLNPHERENLRVEAQILGNLFASFEKEGIFTRTWLPLTSRVQKKLRRQGSKFAEAEAFRVYRFRKGAWSEIILGAVMGAARRADEEKIANGEPLTTRRTSSAAKASAAKASAAKSEPVLSMPPSNEAATLANYRRPTPQPQPVMRDVPRTQPPSAESTAAYGKYARYNPPNPRGAADATRADATRAANSNTSPSARRERDSAAADVAVPAGAIEALVAFSNEAAPLLTPAPVATTTAPRADDTVVVLRRETASFTIPQYEASPADLLGRIETALAMPATTATYDPSLDGPAAAGLAQIEAQVGPYIAGPYVIENDFDFDHIEDDEPAIDLDTDPATADAIAIASRLRPARAAEG
jgi:hypothetical protein